MLQNDIRNCEMSIDDHKQKKDELEQRKKKEKAGGRAAPGYGAAE